MLRFRRLPSYMDTFPFWGGGSLSAQPSAGLLSVGEKGGPRSRLCLLRPERTIVFMCQKLWQGLQTQRGWLRAAERIDVVGCSWLEEIPEKKSGNNTNPRNSAVVLLKTRIISPAACQSSEAEVMIQQTACCFLQSTLKLSPATKTFLQHIHHYKTKIVSGSNGREKILSSGWKRTPCSVWMFEMLVKWKEKVLPMEVLQKQASNTALGKKLRI